MGEKVEEVVLSVGGVKADLEAQLQYIGGGVEELTNITQFMIAAAAEAAEQEEEARKKELEQGIYLLIYFLLLTQRTLQLSFFSLSPSLIFSLPS